MELRLSDILKHVSDARLIRGAADGMIRSISTDTRSLESGDVFVALRGENFDGNEYIDAAVESGATGIIASDRGRIRRMDIDDSSIWILETQDTQKILGEIASLWRKQMCPEHVAVIAGSAGKTTCKEMIGSVLGYRDDCLITEKNYNNLIGVPLNLFRLEPQHTIAVLEIGMNEPGELRHLIRITDPTTALLVNISRAHIGKLGSLDNLLAAKGEVLDELNPETTFIYNADCPLTAQLISRKRLPAQTLTFGLNSSADVRATHIKAIDPQGYRFHLTIGGKKSSVQLHVFGRHNIYNALAAAALLHSIEIDLSLIIEGLEQFTPYSLRSEIELFEGMHLIKDCYNASPDAVISALKSLVEFSRDKGRCIAVLGDMRELGEFERDLHREVAQVCLDEGIDTVVTVGDAAASIVQYMIEKKSNLPAFYFQDRHDAVKFLTAYTRENDCILFKASRLLTFETIIEEFKTNYIVKGSRALSKVKSAVTE